MRGISKRGGGLGFAPEREDERVWWGNVTML